MAELLALDGAAMIDAPIVPHRTRVRVPITVDGRELVASGMVIAVRNARRYPIGFGRHFEQAASVTVLLDVGGRVTVPPDRVELEVPA